MATHKNQNGHQRSGNLLLDERPLTLLPSLARKFGLGGAVILQQVHWLLQQPRNGIIDDDGYKWVWGTYEEWCADYFCFWKPETLRKQLINLEKRGVIISSQLRKSHWDRTKYYRIDYDLVYAEMTDEDLDDDLDAEECTASIPNTDTGSIRDESTASKRDVHTDSSIHTKSSTKNTTKGIAPDQSQTSFLDQVLTPQTNGRYSNPSKQSRSTGKTQRSRAHAVESSGVDLKVRTALVDLVIDAHAMSYAINEGGDDKELYRMQGIADSLINMGFSTIEKMTTLIENAKATSKKDVLYANMLVQHASMCLAKENGKVSDEYSKPTTNHLDRRSQAKAASDADAEARFGHYNALLDESFVPDPL